jgi:outer membrane protein TolC
MISLKVITATGMGCLLLAASTQAQVTEFDSNNWARQVQQQLQQHPRWQRLVLEQKSSEFDLQASTQPLYNPELEMSYENNAEDSYELAFSQQLDWYGKRENGNKLAETEQQITHYERQLQINEMIASALNSMVELQSADIQLQQAELRLQLTSRLIDAARKRVNAGDLNTVDLQLVELSLANAVLARNEAETRKQIAESETIGLLGSASINIPTQLFDQGTENPPNFDQLGMQLPEFQIVHWQAQKKRAVAKQARLNAKPEPTVGLGFGRDGDENTVRLSLSIPLNVRNTFNAEIRAADNRSLEAEQNKQDVRWQIRSQLQSAWNNWQRTKGLIAQWPLPNPTASQSLHKQLEKQWHLGDLDTSSYLQNLQQQNESLAASIQLKSQANLSFIEWLRVTNQLESWLESKVN